jgi:NhaP-type Na+/H+ or K+/H+ antiporter
VAATLRGKPLLPLATRIWNYVQSLANLALFVFVALKLTGVVAWSWWWVLTPLWITGIVAVPLLCLLVAMTWRDRRSRRLLGVYQGEE